MLCARPFDSSLPVTVQYSKKTGVFDDMFDQVGTFVIIYGADAYKNRTYMYNQRQVACVCCGNYLFCILQLLQLRNLLCYALLPILFGISLSLALSVP